jgi:hypothetical protein
LSAAGTARRALPLLAATVLSAGMLLAGLDSDVGQAALAILVAALAAAALLLVPPSGALWRGLVPVAAFTAAAVAWATMPDWVPLGLRPAAMPARTLVPDRIAIELVARVGLFAALVTGRLIARDRAGAAHFLDAMLAWGAVNLLVGLLVVASGNADAWELWPRRADGRFTATLGNANVAGVYCGVLATAALSRAIVRQRAARGGLDPAALACWTMLVLACGAGLATGSRSAMATTATALLAIAARPALAGRRRWALPLLAVAALAALLVAAGLADLTAERLDGSVEMSLRPLMWQHYAAVAARSPWWGYGLGSFPTLNLASLTDPRTAQALWTVNAAHNIALGAILAGGWPYLLLLATAGAVVAAGIARGRGADGRDALLGGLFVMVGCASVDIALDVPAVAATAALTAGLAWGYPARSRSASRTSRQRSITGA